MFGVGLFSFFLFLFLFPLLSSSLFPFLLFSPLPGSIEEERREQEMERHRERTVPKEKSVGQPFSLEP